MDLTELVKGTIPSITAQLSTLTDDDLAQLLALESAAASPRSGLLAAIKTEQEARAGNQTARDENDALIAANAQIAELNESNATLTDANTALTAQVKDLEGQVSTLTDTNATLTAATADHDALREQVEELQAQLAAAGMTSMVVESAGKAVALLVGGDIGKLTRVVFGDAYDRLLTQIPGLQFNDADFVRADDGSVLLNSPISFPRMGPTNDVSSAWLVGDEADGQLTGAVCRFVIPIGTGGGRAVELPAGHLRFSTSA
jgi:prefoldin subunit 5